MIVQLVKVLRREFRELLKKAAFERYRDEMRDIGVFIDPRANIEAVGGIRLGEGTKVWHDATIAATGLNLGCSLHGKPNGSIEVGRRCTFLPGAIVASYGGKIVIGDDVSINPGVILYGHGGLRIGDKTRIAAQTVVVPANHRFGDWAKPIMEQGLTCKGITIGRDVWIGAGVRILDGVTVGDGAVIAAGAVVTRDVEESTVVGGIPAREIGRRQFPEELIT